MQDSSESLATPDDQDAEERSLAADLRVLVDHGIDFVAAEVELQKARAAYAGGAVRTIAILGVFAGLLVCFALVALTVGLVIALAPLLGALGAAFAVFAVYLVIAFICVTLAAARWRAMTNALANRENRP